MHIIHNELWFNGRFCANDDNMIRLRTGPDEDLCNLVEIVLNYAFQCISLFSLNRLTYTSAVETSISNSSHA